MYFAMIAFDRPVSRHGRELHAADHPRYLEQRSTAVHSGGPSLDPGTGAMEGSPCNIDVDDDEAAREFIAGEPSAKADPFESTSIRRWTQGGPEAVESASELMDQELDRQRRENGT